jgi:hypothetical protein
MEQDFIKKNEVGAMYAYVARVHTTWEIESYVRNQYAYHVQPRSRGG